MTEQTATPSRSKKFIRDLGIYAIGNLGSKLITFLLVPFYTHFITNTADYGYYELALTISFCFVPLLCFQMNDGGFRFLIDTKDTDRHRSIISFISRTLIINILIIIFLTIGFNILHPIKFFPFILAYGITQTIYEVSVQITRGLGHTKLFVSAGIINAFLTAILSIVLLAGFRMSIEGIFIAAVCAKVITFIFIDKKLKLLNNYIKRSCIDRRVNKELLRYSLPLVPVALCWWFITANNQFFIERYLGLTQNGYYGLACRFTGILYVFCNIFYQAWQQNALEQYHTPNRNLFFSEIFNNYFFLLCAVVSVFPFIIRLNYPWLVGQEYQDSSDYLFLNSIYVMAFALAAFFEIGYQCSKKTSRILPSLLMAIFIGIACNILLIKRFEVYGVITSSIITYLSLLVYRVIDTNKYIHIRFSPKNYLPLGAMICCGIIYHIYKSYISDILVCCVMSAFFIAIIPSNLKSILLRKSIPKH